MSSSEPTDEDKGCAVMLALAFIAVVVLFIAFGLPLSIAMWKWASG
jgi:hypothetical protein